MIDASKGFIKDGNKNRLREQEKVIEANRIAALRLLGEAADADWKERIERVPIEGCTVKLNVHLRELPNFKARPGTNEPHHY